MHRRCKRFLYLFPTMWETRRLVSSFFFASVIALVGILYLGGFDPRLWTTRPARGGWRSMIALGCERVGIRQAFMDILAKEVRIHVARNTRVHERGPPLLGDGETGAASRPRFDEGFMDRRSPADPSFGCNWGSRSRRRATTKRSSRESYRVECRARANTRHLSLPSRDSLFPPGEVGRVSLGLGECVLVREFNLYVSVIEQFPE